VPPATDEPGWDCLNEAQERERRPAWRVTNAGVLDPAGAAYPRARASKPHGL